jgi:hypothetical protein
MTQYSYLVGALGVDWPPESEQAQLNELGAQGWELVSVVSRVEPAGKPCVYYYLRREDRGKSVLSSKGEIGLQL